MMRIGKIADVEPELVDITAPNNGMIGNMITPAHNNNYTTIANTSYIRSCRCILKRGGDYFWKAY